MAKVGLDLWPTMAAHRLLWLDKVGHGRRRPTMAKVGLDLLPTMAAQRRPWPAMVGHGRSRPAMAKVEQDLRPTILCSFQNHWSCRGSCVVVVCGRG